MTTLYTRISDEFDFEAPQGVLVCASRLEDTHGFTEQGYDTPDYDVAPTVYEVIPTVDKFASEAEAVAAGRAAGIVIFDTHEDIENANKAGTFTGSWAKGDCYCLEEEPINRLVLESEAFRAALSKSGISAIQDVVAIGNTQPTLTLLWVPGTYELNGPLAVEPICEDDPYEVRLADKPTPALTLPRP